MVRIINVDRDDIVDNVKVADTFLKRVKGLMFRSHGRMFFKFKQEQDVGIWMLFMKFPLDIAFIEGEEKSGKIIKIVRNARPVSFNPKTWRIYHARCRYVLEAEADTLKKWKDGDKVKIEW